MPKTISSIKTREIVEPCLGEWGATNNPHNNMKIVGKIIPIKIFKGNEYFVRPIVTIRIAVAISVKNLIGALNVNKLI
ncbi:hypothetical protein LKI01_24190 [Companilactobacillus paralimentarius]|nr:hypothetical protein ATN91_07785 [Companilactobacillus kimchii]GEO48420.1 hypothetical protein LKI01_24190 [Companilactobacillus paralimentarius]